MKTYLDNGFLYYYDIHIKLWTVIEVDENKNQISEEADHFGDKKQMLKVYPFLQFKKEER